MSSAHARNIGFKCAAWIERQRPGLEVDLGDRAREKIEAHQSDEARILIGALIEWDGVKGDVAQLQWPDGHLRDSHAADIDVPAADGRARPPIRRQTELVYVGDHRLDVVVKRPAIVTMDVLRDHLAEHPAIVCIIGGVRIPVAFEANLAVE
jgi:hypothetical protein